MLPEWLPWLLQVNDSQFPSGAYAHSQGLEGLAQLGIVERAEDVEAFLHQQIIPSLRDLELPLLARAHSLATAADIQGLRALDEELDAWKLAAELRQASRQLGSRRLALIQKLDPDPLLAQYSELASPCHHMIIFALEFRTLPAAAVACAFAYQAVNGYATAAMKLVRMGQEKCQITIRGAMLALTPIIENADPMTRGEPGWFNPLLEIASMRHARAKERLFIS
jgi:urease accessory protein